MEYRKLGKTGLSVSTVGFGGAEIGFAPLEPAAVSRLLNAALDAGINVIDTAAAYLVSETMIGRALSHRRKDFYLTTKCGAIDGFARSDWSKDGIVRTVERSLKNLQTDHVDVLLLHSCAILEMAWGEALAGLQAARDKGYTRFIGYSGDGAPALWAIRSGRFDVVEVSVNIADQEAIDLLLPEADRAEMGVIVKRPIANAAWRYEQRPQNDYHAEYWQRLKKLNYDFLKSDRAGEAALRFTLSQPAVSTAIVGTTRPERFESNVRAAAAGPLPAAELEAIRTRWREAATVDWLGQN